MKRFLLELGVRQDEYVVFYDSQSAMDLRKNATYHSLHEAHRCEVPQAKLLCS